MAIRRVIVCEAQVPFVSGGAEIQAGELIRALRERGYETERVAVPFKWYPKSEILAHAAAWRLLDLSESNGQPIDLVIATKFPTYFVRHPNKVTWLTHQYRGAYDLCGTPFGDFHHTEADVALKDHILRLDREMLSECRRLFTIARNTATRLATYNGIHADVLYPPPRLASRLHAGPSGSYVLAVGRLETLKRPDLLVRAVPFFEGGLRLVLAGDGPLRSALEETAAQLGVSSRVVFAGRVSDESLVELYAEALGVVYVPYDEDYGYVTLEGFLARKPMVTAADSGGTLEFVENGLNGLVCDPAAEAIGAAVNALSADRGRAARFGEAGFERARTVTWTGVIEKLVGDSGRADQPGVL
jgi:glycosyltransferase involved in cell wall biosynthesis